MNIVNNGIGGNYALQKKPRGKKSQQKIPTSMVLEKQGITKEALERRKKKKIEWLRTLKEGLLCIQCGENHPATLDFHHINAEEKAFPISRALHLSREKIMAEMKKCKVLCSNCHRKLHWNLKYGNGIE